MSYRAYSGPRGSETVSPLEKARLLYKEFETLDAALAWARPARPRSRAREHAAKSTQDGSGGCEPVSPYVSI